MTQPLECPQPLQCPQCRRAMSAVEYEGVTVQTCEGCGGEFVASDNLGHIVRTRQEGFDEKLQTQLADSEPVFGIPDEARERTLACPKCDEPMDVVNYSTDSGIMVDRCPRCHGIWLDHLELEKVQALLERWSDEAPAAIRSIAGELEEARRQAAASTKSAFAGSRFSFVNALINRLLDAA